MSITKATLANADNAVIIHKEWKDIIKTTGAHFDTINVTLLHIESVRSRTTAVTKRH